MFSESPGQHNSMSHLERMINELITNERKRKINKKLPMREKKEDLGERELTSSWGDLVS